MKDGTRTGQMFLTTLLSAKADRRQELRQALVSILDSIQRELGCLECMASQDLVGESRFHLHFVWRDRAALEAFLGGDVFYILLGALQVLAASMEFRIVAAASLIPSAELGMGRRTRAGEIPISSPNPP